MDIYTVFLDTLDDLLYIMWCLIRWALSNPIDFDVPYQNVPIRLPLDELDWPLTKLDGALENGNFIL